MQHRPGVRFLTRSTSSSIGSIGEVTPVTEKSVLNTR